MKTEILPTIMDDHGTKQNSPLPAAGLAVITAALVIGIALGALFGVWIYKGVTHAACVSSGGVC